MDPKGHYESTQMALSIGTIEEADRRVCVLQTDKFHTKSNHFS